jgi:hypothetical protein
LKNDPRNSYQWRKLKAGYKDRCRRSNALCHLCVARGDLERAVIDYAAPPLSKWSFEPDHIKPVETHRHLVFVESNWAPSHSRCNRQRQAAMLKDPATRRPWVKPNF